jgi:hypothetical protein
MTGTRAMVAAGGDSWLPQLVAAVGASTWRQQLVDSSWLTAAG